MRYVHVLEAIRAPYALDLREIIEQTIKAADTPDGLRDMLDRHLTTFLQDKLDDANARALRLVVRVIRPTPSFPAGGAFRGDPHDEDGLPPYQPGVMEIFAFIDDDRLQAWLDPGYRSTHNFGESINALSSTVAHEFVHAMQFSRSAKFGALGHFTINRKREVVDGKRRGKRGGYTNGWTQDKRQYLGQDIEIDAHAASAAAEVAMRARREPVGQQAAYIQNVLRKAADNSTTLADYRQTFRSPDLMALFRGGRSDPRVKQQKLKVWARFKRKLARYLADYLDQMDR